MTPATASGQSTGESRCNTLPSPQTIPAETLTKTASASAPSASQISRACPEVGGGKLTTRFQISNLKFSSPLPQPFRFVRRRAHGIDERATHAGFLEFMDSLDGRAARTGHHVFQLPGMPAGFEHHFAAAKYGLRRELG